MIDETLVKNTVIELLKDSSTKLPLDVKNALEKAYEIEEGPAKAQLEAIIKNIKMAEESSTPLCQDTGVHIFFVKIGDVGNSKLEKKLPNIIIEGVREATRTIPLRPNAVHPLTRKNPGDNVGDYMPYVNFTPIDSDYIEITAMPKGAGSENMSKVAMLNPSDGLKGIKKFALDTVVSAGSKPCPPTIIGLGIGGSADISIKLAKMALLRPIDQRHPDPTIASLEKELFEAFNSLGIGVMGLGGKTTVLGVNAELGYCHTASLPVAINVQCWAGRKATARIYKDGRVEHLTYKR
ncbi:MAG: fumarate hydratase [Candidatus Methanofastidiosum methylothiophilum]|uniref:Fumarate hydratase n=1 Tax=Candidatus Methanofastidiosum methylothiophilum TaxID=1705564 RepID=A0A150J7V5_9EURY|nr:MAG: fumarate hydratase [Candidatus Methanofastidiosum methylthiophilus]